MGFKQLAQKVMEGGHLSRSETEEFANLVRGREINDLQFVALLTAMQTRDEIKGRSVEEYGHFIYAFRQKVDCDIEGVLCNSGTGGGKVRTLNISTPASIVIASAGIPVLKTGSKGTTGSRGSREAFESLGLNPLEELDRVIASTRTIGIGYYDFSKLVPIGGRSCLRTPLNYVGPLCHPIQLNNKVLGCADERDAVDSSRILDIASVENYFISFNPDVDELSLVGETRVIQRRNGLKTDYVFDPRKERLPEIDYSNVAMPANVREGAERTLLALEGGEPDIRNFIALNAAAGIYLAGKTKSIIEGFELASSLMKSGRAYAKLEEWRKYQSGN